MSVLVVATFPSFRSSEVIGDVEFGLNEATEPDGTEIDVEETEVNFFEADGLLGEDGADVDPVAAPADAAVGGDPADEEVGRVGDGWGAPG